MKKFIYVMICMIIMTMMMAGCAKTVEVAPTEVTVPVVETEPATTEVLATSTMLQVFEQNFIDNFGEDNVIFQYSNEGDTYFIGIFVDCSFSAFYNMDDADGTCANLNTLCATGHEISGLDTFLTLYSRIDGVIYASYNGVDFTMEAITIENGG